MCGRFQHLVSSAAAPLRSARGRGCEQKEGATFSSQPPGSGPLRPPGVWFSSSRGSAGAVRPHFSSRGSSRWGPGAESQEGCMGASSAPQNFGETVLKTSCSILRVQVGISTRCSS